MVKFLEPTANEIKENKLYQDMGLSDKEYDKVVDILGRMPNYTEIGIFSVMWSEHCSYKHSKPFLKQFPTTGERVLMGPGEGAGLWISEITRRLYSRLNHITTHLQLNHIKVQRQVSAVSYVISYLSVRVQSSYLTAYVSVS